MNLENKVNFHLMPTLTFIITSLGFIRFCFSVEKGDRECLPKHKGFWVILTLRKLKIRNCKSIGDMLLSMSYDL